MTQKELLYVEDACKHEDNIIKILDESINYLEDYNLIKLFKNDLKKHQTMKEKLMSLMESKINE